MGALRVLRRAFAPVLGLKLYLITSPDGMPAAWYLADPEIGEREAAGLLAHAARTGAPRPGLTLTGDKGFAGRDFEDLVTGHYRLRLVRPDRRDEPTPPRVRRLDPAVDRVGLRHRQGPA